MHSLPLLPPQLSRSWGSFLSPLKAPIQLLNHSLPSLYYYYHSSFSSSSFSSYPCVAAEQEVCMKMSIADATASAHPRGGGTPKSSRGLEVEGYGVEGISIGGQETCVIIPTMKVAFDIGRCPQRAISQDFLFISHAHMDHIGGVAMYVATRGLYRMKSPTVIVPTCIKPTVEKLFEVYRALDGSELKHELVGLDVGEEFNMGKNLLVKPFKTYHVIPSQGYLIYSVKQKLKVEYLGLPGDEIKKLKFSGIEITETVRHPEVAFTGDTMVDFIVDEANADVLRAKVLIMEATFVDQSVSIEHARSFGHVHLAEVVALADRFHNKAIVLIHFSARYTKEEILSAVKNLPECLQSRVVALTEGF